MDPTACLKHVNDSLKPSVRKAGLEDLHKWLTGGGFAPHWMAYPEATRAYVKAYGWRPSMPEEFRPGLRR